jgi:hypothetical protein
MPKTESKGTFDVTFKTETTFEKFGKQWAKCNSKNAPP